MSQKQTMLHHSCPRCGSDLHYSGDRKKLQCGTCKYSRVLGRNSDQVAHHPLKSGVKLTDFSRGLEGDFKSYSCSECGTALARPSEEPLTQCPFCLGEELEEDERHQEVITPTGVIPFTISQQQARDQLHGAFRNFFLAENLRQLAEPDQIRGVYVPFFLYDVLTRNSWRTESGFKVLKFAKEKPVERTAWENTGGYYENFFEGFSLSQTQGAPELDLVLPYDFGRCVPYDPRFLRSFSTELYQIKEVDTFDTVDRQLSEKIRAEIKKRAVGQEQKEPKISSEKFALDFRHVLVPLWVGVFHYQGETFQYLINGQTGEMAGERPLSTRRMMIAVGSAVGLLGLLTIIFG